MAFSVFNQTLDLKRPGSGEYVGGVWQESAPLTLSIRSSVQPSKESDLKLLPEGRRLDASFVLYSRDEIIEQDVVTLFGAPYEVLHVGRWQNRILPHYKAIAVKMQQENVT